MVLPLTYIFPDLFRDVVNENFQIEQISKPHLQNTVKPWKLAYNFYLICFFLPILSPFRFENLVIQLNKKKINKGSLKVDAQLVKLKKNWGKGKITFFFSISAKIKNKNSLQYYNFYKMTRKKKMYPAQYCKGTQEFFL